MRSWALGLLLLLCSFSAAAIERAQLQFETWSFVGISASEFAISLEFTDSGFAVAMHADRLALPEPWQYITQVEVTCAAVAWHAEQLNCQQGQLSFQHPRYGQQQLTFTLLAQADKQQYQFTLQNVRLAGATLALRGNIKDEDWRISAEIAQLDLAQLSPLLRDWLTPIQQSELDAWSYDGKLDLTLDAAGTAASVEQLQADWLLSAMNFSNQDASQVAEAIQLSGTIDLQTLTDVWHWQMQAELLQGQVYSHPLFVDITAQPLSIKLQGQTTKSGQHSQISNLEIKQPGVLDARVALSIVDNAIERLDVQHISMQLATSYPLWLQPFTIGTAAAELTMDGQLTGSIHWQRGDYQLQLALEDINISDQANRFALSGLFGQINIATDTISRDSYLRWQDAQLYALSLGGSELAMQSQGQTIRLTQEVDLPVLDGALKINGFNLQRDNSGALSWSFNGELSPISMEKLSQALGWPILHGDLSGTIPHVRYQNQQLVMDGELAMRVFDGAVIISDLAMTSPLGALPQLHANIDMTGLDLALLTSAFDFGNITGRVDGYVHDLRLAAWQPVQFDAQINTAEKNPGKRRISQRAVDNLTQLGGGATGMLSRSFLRFFEDFSYQQLGFSCRLMNDVCLMDGIGAADTGYYIVKGGGLPPWINVVGYTHRVDWADLIARLKAIQNSDGPVIQ